MMLKKVIATLAVFAAVSGFTATSANAFNVGNFGARVLSESRAPKSYIAFCNRNPSECKADGVGVVSYNSHIRSLITMVNNRVNRTMRERNDSGPDVWTVNASSGDCEDFALTKRSQLIRAGVPAGALRMAVVVTQRGVGHAVLVVKTNRGEFVLDNLRRSIVKRNQTGYAFLRVASANPRVW